MTNRKPPYGVENGRIIFKSELQYPLCEKRGIEKQGTGFEGSFCVESRPIETRRKQIALTVFFILGGTAVGTALLSFLQQWAEKRIHAEISLKSEQKPALVARENPRKQEQDYNQDVFEEIPLKEVPLDVPDFSFGAKEEPKKNTEKEEVVSELFEKKFAELLSMEKEQFIEFYGVNHELTFMFLLGLLIQEPQNVQEAYKNGVFREIDKGISMIIPCLYTGEGFSDIGHNFIGGDACAGISFFRFLYGYDREFAKSQIEKIMVSKISSITNVDREIKKRFLRDLSLSSQDRQEMFTLGGFSEK